MSDNLLIKDGAAANQLLKTTETAGVHSPHHIIDGVDIVEGPFTLAKGLRVFGGPTDPVSDIPVMIDFAHHQVHEGETYKALHKNLTGTVTPATTQEYSVAVGAHTPAISSPHMLFGFEVYDGAILVEIYENPSGTATGTTITAYNHNRNSTNTPTLVAKHTVTGLSAGTLIDAFYVAAGSKSSDDRATSEWLLKVSTTYRIVVTPKVNSSNYIANLNWYEDLGV